jgi:hypothetical protein
VTLSPSRVSRIGLWAAVSAWVWACNVRISRCRHPPALGRWAGPACVHARLPPRHSRRWSQAVGTHAPRCRHADRSIRSSREVTLWIAAAVVKSWAEEVP